MPRINPQHRAHELSRINEIIEHVEAQPLPEFAKFRSNHKIERNQQIILAIKANISTGTIAEAFGISRQCVSQVWKRFGTGEDLRSRRRRLRQEGKL